MNKLVIVVFTDTKLKNTIRLPKYAYYTDKEDIEVGDHFESSRDGRWVQVVDIRKSKTTTFNGKSLNKLMRMENKSKMIQGIREKYMSQYIPERVPNAKMSADGSIVLHD